MYVLFLRPVDFPVSFSNRETRGTLGIVLQEVLWSIRGSYSTIRSLPLTNVNWHSDPWPATVTAMPVRPFTNSMTLIPSLTLTEIRVVSMERLQRVCHANRERLPFRTPDSVLLFGTCLYSNCWDQLSGTCRVFTRVFTLNILRYFLDFAKHYGQKRCNVS